VSDTFNSAEPTPIDHAAPTEIVGATPDRRRVTRSSPERRNLTTRAEGVWTDAERDRFIQQVREARRDAHAITIQGGQELSNPKRKDDA
jgi:hypothetical protein